MKILYRIIIALILVAGCFWLIKYPVLTTDTNEVFSGIEDPVRGQVPEHTGGIARDHLKEPEQLIYDAIYEAIETEQPAVTIPVSSYSQKNIEVALFSVLDDCPQFFWMDFTDFTYLSDYRGLTLNFKYLYTGEVLRGMKTQLDNAVTEVVNAVNAQNFTSEYDKALYVHDYIDAICEYDRTLAASGIQDSYGALVSRLAVCDGYAHSFQLVMQKLGIECHYVPGEAEGPNGVEGHAWNIVKLDGVYTSVDLTWDDFDSYVFEDIDTGGDVVSHIFFGLSDAEIQKTHKVDENFQYKLPEAVDRNWFAVKGVTGASVDEIADKAADILIANLDKTVPYVEFQLTDKAAFHDFKETYQGGIIDSANEKLREAGRNERFLSEMGSYVTSGDRQCILILGTVETIE